ncbi:hypothetical protein K2Z84_09235 [Candidatus Binatia bacterium]|nr:hypothetical protein [Candidatus Binatia bacterium]
MKPASVMSGLQRQATPVLLAALGVLLLAHGGHFYAVDNYAVYLTGEAFVDGHLDIEQGLGTVVGADGRSYGMYTFGLPMLQSAFAIVGGLADARWPGGFRWLAGPSVSIYYPESFGVFAASLVTCLFGAFTIAEVWVVSAALGYARRSAALVTLIALFSTQLWPAARDSFPQIVVAFCILAAIGHLATWRDPAFRRAPLVVGCFLGLLIAVRPFDAVLAVPPIGVYALWQERDEIRRRTHVFTRSLLALALPMVLSALLVGAHNAARFGSPFVLIPAGQTTIAFNNPILDGMYGLLLSGHRGIVFYSPPVVLGVVGLVLLARRRPAEALLFGILIVAFVLSYARYALWDAGVSWGGRFLVPIVALAVLPVGELLQRNRALAAAVLALGVMGFFVQVMATSVDFHRIAVRFAASSAGAGISNPILLHWASLRGGENLDWFLFRVARAHGWLPAVAYACVPILLLACAIRGLRRAEQAGVIGDHRVEAVRRAARRTDARARTAASASSI